MKKSQVSLQLLNIAVQMLDYKKTVKSAVMTLKDGSRMTSTLNIFETPEGVIMLNISDCVTYEFENKAEFAKYLNKKFQIFESEKEMWTEFCGMDDETWEEWNK